MGKKWVERLTTKKKKPKNDYRFLNDKIWTLF
jgi:hypothetical protein